MPGPVAVPEISPVPSVRHLPGSICQPSARFIPEARCTPPRGVRFTVCSPRKRRLASLGTEKLTAFASKGTFAWEYRTTAATFEHLARSRLRRFGNLQRNGASRYLCDGGGYWNSGSKMKMGMCLFWVLRRSDSRTLPATRKGVQATRDEHVAFISVHPGLPCGHALSFTRRAISLGAGEET